MELHAINNRREFSAQSLAKSTKVEFHLSLVLSPKARLCCQQFVKYDGNTGWILCRIAHNDEALAVRFAVTRFATAIELL